ncbi:MAG: CocE/NonD family hydrolase [Thalassobaculaceae bacterium]|nr:CocE/NonD family hydrolase [Thalassobaculaceae bacterium]
MTQRDHAVLENEWISLAGGTSLAARIWMPTGAEADPVPAVLEYLPYRKRNGTAPRDESTYPLFAAAGIAGVRVDIRGSGESDGVIDGEYSERELSDACAVIDWIARQPWSNGSVGMMGISWGGFNCLQVAALKPPALKAVISIASSVDRYNDDIHYKGGTHLSAQLSWAATMLAYQSRPPDPAIVGEAWRAMWMERLAGEPFMLEEWLAHQRRDAFWKHGSIGEDFGGFPVPALMIAGWADGYRTTPFKAVEGMPDKAKALVGPWTHKYPHFAWPTPRADFHGEAIRWWNRWLRDEANGAERTPQMRAFILDGPKPSLWRDRDPGFWIAKRVWTAPEQQILGVTADGRLGDTPVASAAPVTLRSPLDTGTAAGEWFTLAPDTQMASDQRGDDMGSLVFDTPVLEEEILLLGRAEVSLTLSCDAPLANLCARLVDLHPDGTATRIAFGVLNLAHRDGNENPTPMTPGEPVAVALTLDACGYRLAPGHRLRLSLSSAYWPTILPPPFDATLTLDIASLRLSLPLLGAHERIAMPEPENPEPLPTYDQVTPGSGKREVRRILSTGTTEYRITEDSGLIRHPGNGLCSAETRDEVWSIRAGDPLSSTGRVARVCVTRRDDGWETKTVSTCGLSCTAQDWRIEARVQAFENGEQMFDKSYTRSIPRDMM